MCGICGIFQFNKPVVNPAIIKEMVDTLVHRGPDDEGYYINSKTAKISVNDKKVYKTEGQGNVILGHRRLSIIDLSSGHQPMGNESRSVWVTYNGEIYNFRVIRKELELKGHKFSTSSDTEVIVHAYEEWGSECVHRFRGMFAFVIWDNKKKSLFLARDRLGIKPLYYMANNDVFLFASELKAILAFRDVNRTIDKTALYDYFSLGYINAPKSIYLSIRALSPGHTLTVKSECPVIEKRYWDISFANVHSNLSEEEWICKIQDKLQEAVNMRLISDVPLGAFLSGGTDSSAVVVTISNILSDSVKTCSIGFKEQEFNELPYAKEMANRYKTDHFEKILSVDAVDIINKLAWYCDEPFADSSIIPTYYVSKVAREQVTVSLSGDGGDEVFAGYDTYSSMMNCSKIRNRIPGVIRSTLIRALASLYPKADWLPRVFRAKLLLSGISMSPIKYIYYSKSFFRDNMKALFTSDFYEDIGAYSSLNILSEIDKEFGGDDYLSRLLYIDIKNRLVGDMLTKVDRASMANSLEVRVPLLDHEFVELAATIPSFLKLNGRKSKYIFKKSLENSVPNNILYRNKMGFSIPLSKWLRGDLYEMFCENVFRNDVVNEYLNIDTIEHMWKRHQNKLSNFEGELWSILFFGVWAKKWCNA